ncbi:hypothetical protein BGLA2_2960006 [Burkholderia gladioli]|nr:hypothetical protein BGLA2_2960006 [Burkholderia gladioli]
MSVGMQGSWGSVDEMARSGTNGTNGTTRRRHGAPLRGMPRSAGGKGLMIASRAPRCQPEIARSLPSRVARGSARPARPAIPYRAKGLSRGLRRDRRNPTTVTIRRAIGPVGRRATLDARPARGPPLPPAVAARRCRLVVAPFTAALPPFPENIA